jgi:hypothetical protein
MIVIHIRNKNEAYHPAPNTITFFFPTFSCLETVCINRLKANGDLDHDRNIVINKSEIK